jgi:predicted ATPase
MQARSMSQRLLFSLGYPDRALARGLETVAIARTQREPLTRVFAMVILHGVYMDRGDSDHALKLHDDIEILCREHGLPQEAEWSRSFHGATLIGMGRAAEGIDVLRVSLAAQDSMKTHLARPIFLGMLAEGLRREFQDDEGLAVVADGLDYAARMHEAGYVSELYRIRGQLLALRGDDDAAEASLRAAIADAATRQAKAMELRAATALSHLLLRHGRAAAARQTLAPVVTWFTEGHATRDVATATALLETVA